MTPPAPIILLHVYYILTNLVGDVGTGTYLTITGVRKQQHCLMTGQNEPTTKSITATPPLQRKILTIKYYNINIVDNHSGQSTAAAYDYIE